MALQMGQFLEERRIELTGWTLGGEEEGRESETGDDGLRGEEGRGLRLSLMLRDIMMSFCEGEDEGVGEKRGGRMRKGLTRDDALGALWAHTKK